MRLLLIHQYFAGPTEPGGTRHYELAAHLVRAGHECALVASTLNFAAGKRVAKGRGLVVEENVDGIRVLRSYTIPTLHKGFSGRVVALLSFMITSIVAALWAGPVDLVMGTSPPLFQAVSAWLVALLRRRPLLLEIRDLWPEFAIDIGVLKNPVLIRLSRWVEMFLYRRAAHILVNSPAYRDYLLGKGVPDEKISVIANGVDPDMFTPDALGRSFRDELGLGDKFVITYAGALGMANDIDTILRAAARLRTETRIRFLLVGDGKERPNLEAKAKQFELANLKFVGTRTKSEMANVLAASDACLATLKNIPMFRTTYPNKVFDYMAAGRPTILAIDGVIRQVIDAAGGGIFVPPGDDRALAAAAQSLCDDREKGARWARPRGATWSSTSIATIRPRLLSGWWSKWLACQLVNANMNRLYRTYGKRALDLAVAVPALIVAAPLMALVAVLIRWRLGSPVVFRQQRPGLREKPFMLYKFRTMTDQRDSRGELLPDAERLPAFGIFLRRSSLDELPQLWNVVRGDMTLVGPRPLMMRYLGRYSEEQRRRHHVVPGITGWAQVNGRNEISWERKFELDVWYVDHLDLWLDLKILWLTFLKTVQRSGISAEGHATAPEFEGTNPLQARNNSTENMSVGSSQAYK